jgi:hypothetical protein
MCRSGGLAVAVLGVALAFVFAGCAGRAGSALKPVQVLNIPLADDTGFVNSCKVKGVVSYPGYMVLISEYPGSGKGQLTRRFVASPVRLGKVGITAGGVVNPKTLSIENSKFLVDIVSPELVDGLPAVMEPDTLAILKYQGNCITRDSVWELDAVDTGVSTLRLVATARKTQAAGTTASVANWICTSIPSSGIKAVKDPEQRIRPIP